MSEMSEDAQTAAVIYRRLENQAYKAGNVRYRIQSMMAEMPDIASQINRSWTGVQEDIMERFRSMIPKNGKGGPKVFEVHHEIEVAKECFLVSICEKMDAGRGVDAEYAANFTRRRLGLTGNIEDFYREMGLLEVASESPEPM